MLASGLKKLLNKGLMDVAGTKTHWSGQEELVGLMDFSK